MFQTSGDTTLAGHAYNKLFLNSFYHGAIRDSSKRVYFRGIEDSIEHVLYDFNKMLGDTIVAPYPMEAFGNSSDTIRIWSEEQLPTTDGFRRKLGLISSISTEWIEGIGNFWWLTSPAYRGSVSGGTFLTCFFDSTQLVYALDGEMCSSSTEEETNLMSRLALYPNPTQGLLIFPVLPNDPFDVSVCDITGRAMLFFPNVNAPIDVSSVPDGVYLVCAQTKTHKKIFRVVKLANR